MTETLPSKDRRFLNRNLRHRPFHGQYCSFVKQPEADLKQVLDWVLDWTPEQGSDVGGLFDAADDPNHPHREAIARVRNMLMEAAGGEGRAGGWDERLADYRQYYHFDVRMSDDKDGGSVHIDADYIKPEARRALAADNPVVRPDGADLIS